MIFYIRRKYKDKRLKDSIFSFKRFVIYFFMMCFMVSVSFMLFFSKSMFTQTESPVFIPVETINERAVRTFFNIFFISAFFSTVDGLRKRIFTQKPVHTILDGLKKITDGDFSVRIKPIHKRRAYNEYDLIIEDFNKMAAELSSIETLKTDFISNVSHELKTPLAVIRNYASMLSSGNLSDEDRCEYIEGLSNASKKLNDLITSILKLNKLENQLIFPVVKRYNLSEQLCQALLLFENEWDEKNLTIHTELDESIEIEADEELLLIVWSNLISNAVKFSDNGDSVFVSLKKEGKRAVVTVKDTGCGMDESTGVHIFEKFYQGDTSRATYGNGLGLALVKRVIDITKSEIIVESAPGVGSSFTVKINISNKM